jgi:hypothetical protein
MTIADRGADPCTARADAPAAATEAAEGVHRLVRGVVPLWVRHLQAAREEADRGVNALLQNFSSLGSELADVIAETGQEHAAEGDSDAGKASPTDASQRLQVATQRLSNEMDLVFAGFQFQDRLNQMLGILQDDMNRLENWLENWLEQPDSASPPEVAEWLARLERTYTMDEQRAVHHGTPTAPSAGGVDYF